jgi:hypothetical protein
MPDRPDLVHLDVEGDLQGVIGEDPPESSRPRP